jgi:hypothetical protein
MAALLVFLLVAILLLLCEPVEKRPRTLGGLVLIGIALWLAVKLCLIEGLVAIALGSLRLLWQHRAGAFISLGVLFFVWFFGYLAYCAIRDQIDNWAIRKGRMPERISK